MCVCNDLRTGRFTRSTPESILIEFRGRGRVRWTGRTDEAETEFAVSVTARVPTRAPPPDGRRANTKYCLGIGFRTENRFTGQT